MSRPTSSVYAQRVLGEGAVVAGLAVGALAIGWPIAASTAGRFYLRWGYRPCLFAGAVFGLVGTGTVALVGPGSPVWVLALGCLVLGLGLGSRHEAGAVDLDGLPVAVLDPALHAVFVAVAATSVLLVVAALVMPPGSALTRRIGGDGAM